MVRSDEDDKKYQCSVVDIITHVTFAVFLFEQKCKFFFLKLVCHISQNSNFLDTVDLTNTFRTNFYGTFPAQYFLATVARIHGSVTVLQDSACFTLFSGGLSVSVTFLALVAFGLLPVS